MKGLLSEILRLAELEAPDSTGRLARLLDAAKELEQLTLKPPSIDPPDYIAIDSGYIELKYRHTNLLLITITKIDNKINNNVIIKKIERTNNNINRYVRELELKSAAEEKGYVLVDGPLTPYIRSPIGYVIGVSKDPVAARYWRSLGGKEAEWFKEISSLTSELYGAEILLQDKPRGTMLKPVDLGEFFATYIKGDSVFYIEFPRYIPLEVISSFFKYGYPIKLRLAHRYAKISRELLRSLRVLIPRFIDIQNRYREYL
ncbi:DNA double-strand break repair nuclease NurA [Thermoproteus tenax]|uniref:Predicted NurA-like nuclease n=1 Tax=Thermoproteus tenax (strain ATCC 35583 / DSM 2078 / JCM 9277 / NBRC 100435 / Kra 1) TaxID=768679 RepID=G4RKV9_THETK|nr:DNA double-strand break repair nuclease NurA [Thermoproteus tenax]CCC82204.1 Predicted NurA-like nuclease [Thermoproteus tenax Kra 1]